MEGKEKEVDSFKIIVSKDELKYVLETLEYGLENCSDDSGNTEIHFNRFMNSINTVEAYLSVIKTLQNEK